MQGLIVYCLKIVLLLLSFFFVFLLINNKNTSKIFDSIFIRFLTTLVCFFAILQCTILISWIFDKNYPLDNIIYPQFIFTLSWYVYNSVVKKNQFRGTKQKTKIISRKDVFAVIIAVISLSAIVAPPLVKCQHNQLYDCLIISNISESSDDSGHLGFTKNHVQFNRGVLFKSDGQDQVRENAFYPSSWSAANIAVVSTFIPNIRADSTIMLVYISFKLFWLFMLSVFIFRVTDKTVRYIDAKKNNRTLTFSIIVFSLFFCYQFVIPYSQDGAFSFVPQVIYLLLFMFMLLGFDRKKSSDFLPAMLIATGGCLSWLLPLPAFIIALLVVIFKITNKSNRVSSLIMTVYSNAPIILLVFSSIIIQLTIMLFNDLPESISLVASLSIPGSRVIRSIMFYIFYLIGFVYYYINLRNKKTSNGQYILLASFGLFVCCSCIYFVQNLSTGMSSYYLFKTMDLLFISLTPFVAWSYIDFVCNLTKGKPNYLVNIGIVLLVTLSIQLINNEQNTPLRYMAGNRLISSKIDSVIMNELNGRMSISNYNKKELSIYYTSPNYGILSKHATKILLVDKPSNNCKNATINGTYSTSSLDTLINSYIDSYCKDYSIHIFTDKSSYSTLFSDLQKIPIKNNIDIINTN